MKRSWCARAWTQLLLCSWVGWGSSVVAQVEDPLPPLPRGDVELRLERFTTGLPVEQKFVTPVFTQQVGPTDLDGIPGSRDVVVTTYGGYAYRIGPDGVRGAVPFLDLRSPASPSYSANFEFGFAHGFTSIAFHPRFADPTHPGYRKFYTLEAERKDAGPADFWESVVPGNDHQEALYEYHLPVDAGGNCAAECVLSKRELLRVTQPGWHHNLGDLAFDTAGLLYIGSGDGSTAGYVGPFMSDNSQVLSNVFGKVLRIDPLGSNSGNGRYGIPADNPFLDGAGPLVDEIFAYGLRNPYRLEFDPADGSLYASETGELKIENIERLGKGTNHGWNLMEGTFVYDRASKRIFTDLDEDGSGRGDTAEAMGYTDPVLQYDRSNGIAVVGAVPYAGKFIPGLTGQLVFADFTGRLFHGDPKTGEGHEAMLGPGATLPWNIHSVNRDLDGEVYVLGIARLAGGELDGVVVKLHAAPARDGDFDGDGLVAVSDVDFLTRTFVAGRNESLFDLTLDGALDLQDRDVWIRQVAGSHYGDADLNGAFDSGDMVAVFVLGQYEDAIVGNSSWSSGDWDGDLEFHTSDLVVAFQGGAYEARGRVAPVPEPTSGAGSAALAVWLLLRASNSQEHRRKIRATLGAPGGFSGRTDANPRPSHRNT